MAETASAVEAKGVNRVAKKEGEDGEREMGTRASDEGAINYTVTCCLCV